MITELFPTFTLQLGKLKDKISDDEYFELCQINECLVIERNKDGDFEIKSFIGGGLDGNRSAALTGEIRKLGKRKRKRCLFWCINWLYSAKRCGSCFEFCLVSKMKNGKIYRKKQKEKFGAVCPDFIVELRFSCKTC